jgi:alpha-galactosidase
MNPVEKTILWVLLMAALCGTVYAPALLAPTPPMGWNSWDSFGTTVTEDEVKANACPVICRHGRSRNMK